MTVWIDAQFSPALALWFSERFGVPATHVCDLDLLFASDEFLFHSAEKAGAVVITRDYAFAQLAKVLVPPPKALWITAQDASLESVKRILEATFDRAVRLFDAGESLIELKSDTIA